MKITFLFLLVLTTAWLGCGKQTPSNEAKIRFYQSPMHPWIKSDEPGLCTICGMALVPVLEGEDGFDSSGDLLFLPEATIQAIHVESSAVEKGILTRTLRLAGTLDDNAGKHRIISAHFDGRVERPFIEQVGEEVREGQPLAELYSPDLLYVVREFQRAKETNDRRVYEVAGRRLIQFGLTEEQLEKISTRSPDEYGIDILSPMKGTVINRYVNAGQYVKTGDPLFELGDFSTMWFHATVYESDLAFLHLGQEAIITTPAAPGMEFAGILTLIDPNFDPLTRSTTARIEVQNPMLRAKQGERRALPHKAYGEATLEVQMEEGLLVPRSGVLDTGREAIAFVDQSGGQFERRNLQIGARGDTHILVLSGLAEGERVVTRGAFLMDGESQIKNSGGSAPASGPMASLSQSEQLPDNPLDPFLQAVAEIGAALAADDLSAFNKAAREAQNLSTDSKTDTRVLGEQSTHIRQALDQLATEAASLAEARASLLPLSEAAAGLVLDMQALHTGGKNIIVYACPMTDTAFPGAPAKARWIQSGPPIRNPWFGAEMLECGARVLPENKQ